MKLKIPELIAIDTETTGLNPEYDRIWEIALLKIKEGKIEDKFVTLINPEIEIPPYIEKLCGIKNKIIHLYPNFSIVAPKISEFIENRILLFHNAAFDIPFIRKEFQRCNLKFPNFKVIDTLQIAKNYFNFKKNSLSYISKHFKIERKIKHRAEYDAEITYKIFEFLFLNLKEKYTKSLHSLIELKTYRYYKENFPKKIIFDVEEISPDRVLIEKLIRKAVEEKREIIIKYKGKERNVTIRKIFPLELFIENGIIYIKAYCFLRNRERQFRLDRIIKIEENI